MPASLAFYPEVPQAAVDQSPARALDSGCALCALCRRGGRRVCLPDDGEPGGLLVVGEGPGRQEDAAGRPFVGMSGGALRRAVAEHWAGPVAYANATRCYPGGTDISAAMVDACRPYLAGTVREGFERIVALGGWAVYGLLGRKPPVFSVRRGYGFLADGTPVFMVAHPAAGLRNRFVMQWFQADMAWALTSPRPSPQWDGVARLVSTPEDAAQAAAELRRGRWFSFDTETAGTMYESDFRLLSLAACAEGADDAWVWDQAALASPALADPLRDLLTDPAAGKAGQNIKFDITVVALALGAEIPAGSVYADTRLWRRLLDPEASGDLATMAELVGAGGHKDEAVQYRDAGIAQARKLLTAKHQLALTEAAPSGVREVADALRRGKPPLAYAYQCIPRDVLVRYNGLDAVATARLTELLGEQLVTAPRQAAVWERLLRRASSAFSRMERWGVAADRQAVRLFGEHLRLRLRDVRAALQGYGLADSGSVARVREFLFDRLGLKSCKLTKSGLADSTDKSVLEALRGQHPAVDALLEDRRLSKLLTTYADGWDGQGGLVPHILADGRIHTVYNLDGARTGRLSSQDPNLQNQPRPDTPEGRMVRDIYVAPPGYVLLSADYSQLELRVAAMLSGDQAMTDLFRSGMDFHEGTARLIAPIVWCVKDWAALDAATRKKYRTFAKTVNFGLAYGMTDKTLAARLGCAVATARKIREAVLGAFRGYAAWVDDIGRRARQEGAVWTWWDGQSARCRSLWQIADQDARARQHAENGAVNSPVQGTASDYCLASVVAAVDWVVQDGLTEVCRPVLTVHDSIMCEVRADFADEAAYHLRRLMLQWPSGDVPLAVDLEAGPTWGSLSVYVPSGVAA